MQYFDYNHKFKVKDGVLYLSDSNRSPRKIKVQVPSIRKIEVAGKAIVTSGYLHSSNLILHTKQCGSIVLDGVTVNLQKIINHGNGTIKIVWVDNFSSPLNIHNLSKGTIELSGNAIKITTKLSGNSKTLLKQLKVDNSKVILCI